MYISLLHVALNSCLCSYAYSFFYLLTLGKYNFLFLRVSKAWISFEGNFTFFAKRAFAPGRSKALRQSKSLPSFSTTFAHLSETRVACHDDGVFIFRIDPPINYFFHSCDVYEARTSQCVLYWLEKVVVRWSQVWRIHGVWEDSPF